MPERERRLRSIPATDWTTQVEDSTAPPKRRDAQPDVRAGEGVSGSGERGYSNNSERKSVVGPESGLPDSL